LYILILSLECNVIVQSFYTKCKDNLGY
jgi:hypothetical protein